MFWDCHSGLGHSCSLCHLVNVKECFEIVRECFEIVKEFFKIVKECFEIVTLVLVTLWMWKSTNQLGQVRCRDTIATLFDKPWSVFSTFIKKKSLPNLYEVVGKQCVVVKASEIIHSSLIWDWNLTFAFRNYQLLIWLSRNIDIVFHTQLDTFSVVVICTAQWPLTNQYIFKPCSQGIQWMYC